jgi:hypothetical protein
MRLSEISIFPDDLNLKGNAEKRIYREISVNGLQFFYLDDLMPSRTKISSAQKYLEARNFLIKSGVLISVFDLDKELSIYSFGISRKINNTFDPFRPKGKLINITYQDYLFTFRKNNESGAREYVSENKAKEVWLENYNSWLINYYPFIKYRF